MGGSHVQMICCRRFAGSFSTELTGLPPSIWSTLLWGIAPTSPHSPISHSAFSRRSCLVATTVDMFDPIHYGGHNVHYGRFRWPATNNEVSAHTASTSMVNTATAGRRFPTVGPREHANKRIRRADTDAVALRHARSRATRL